MDSVLDCMGLIRLHWLSGHALHTGRPLALEGTDDLLLGVCGAGAWVDPAVLEGMWARRAAACPHAGARPPPGSCPIPGREGRLM